MTTKLSIVSAYYQLEDMTVDFLNNLTGVIPPDTEVILVNAGSKKIEHPIITKRIDLPVNVSFSNSMNAGIKQATGDYVCVIGNDVFPKHGWLKTLLSTALDTGAYITSPINDKTDLKNYRLTKIDKSVYNAEFFPAVCWLISRKCIDRVGLFDEAFKLGTYEDNDYVKRVQLKNGSLVVCTNVVVYHLENQTLNIVGDIRDIMNDNSKIFNDKYNR